MVFAMHRPRVWCVVCRTSAHALCDSAVVDVRRQLNDRVVWQFVYCLRSTKERYWMAEGPAAEGTGKGGLRLLFDETTRYHTSAFALLLPMFLSLIFDRSLFDLQLH